MARPARKQLEAPAPAPAPRDYSVIAIQFEDDVLSGRFPAGAMFRAAVERQRRDLANPPSGYVFDADLGDKACRRAERLPFHEGPKRGQPFELAPFQVWLIRTLFGWVDAVTGWWRFREASLWMPKGNGKSPLAALIALIVLLVARGGNHVYSAASTQKQARHVFDAAREMLRLAPDVREHFGLKVEEHAIKGVEDNRSYEPVSSEAGSIEGIRPTVLVLDEVHVLPNRKLYDNLSSATNKVDGSLLITISTAGFDMSPEAIGWELYKHARDILEGKVDEPATFALIIEADRVRPDGSEASPLDFEVWRQANPNLGVSVSVAGLQKALRTWRDKPSERASIETKHLGWWQSSVSQFLDVRLWDELAQPDLDLSMVPASEGWRLFVGVDLARTRDLTAAPIVASRMRIDGKMEYRIFTRWTYLPRESITITEDPEGPGKWQRWEEEGWITLLPGASMTYAPIKAAIADLNEKVRGLEVCFDEAMASELEADLIEKGVTVVAVKQGPTLQSEPMRELEGAVLDKRLQHDGSPITSMCIGNLRARKRLKDGAIAPDRENEHKKIDIPVGIIDALVRARLNEPAPQSPYSPTRGFQTL